MDDGKRAVLRRKSKDLKKELKEWRRQLLAAGCDKGKLGQYLKEFEETLELGAFEREAYEESKAHLYEARNRIRHLLECMGESTATEVENSLRTLTEHLDGIYHSCLICEDDLDFKSTMDSLKRMIRLQMEDGRGGNAGVKPGNSGIGGTGDGKSYDNSFAAGGGVKNGKGKKASRMSAAALQGAAQAGMSEIMLRSELENIMAVLDDTAGWDAPDFFALAYYFLHEARESLSTMENQQRNEYVAAYTKIHFLDGFLQECGRAHMEEKVPEWIHKYVYDVMVIV